MAAVQGFRRHFGVEVVDAYCVLPLYHVSGLMQALRVLASGGCLALQSYGDLKRETWLPFPQDGFLSLVPTQLQWLLAQGDRYLPRLQTYRAVLLGGAPAAPLLLDQARQQSIPLAPTYGMTETASQVATLLPQEFLAGHQSSGRCLPHVHLEIINDQGDCLAPGAVGAIALETPSLFWGYWPPLPTPRQERFVTDDLGYLDDQGYIHVLGRRSTTIITGGEKVLPQEVEQLLLATGQLADVCVVGLADPHWGQCLCALIVPGLNFLGLDPLISLVRYQLASYKQPKRWLVVAAIPRTTEGKLRRGMALALAQERA
ncbi:MAG: AMP-binding protein [Nodosilinea sp. LVE1205-7]|jgi:O-succinylbenzoic acid--CoA ligase